MSLAVFYDVMRSLKKEGHISSAGFYIADSNFYTSFRKRHPDIDSGKYPLLKEWDILKESSNCLTDISLLRQHEKKYGDPFLWNALLADRRIYLGKLTTIEQDYRSRFSHERMLAILQTAITRMEGLFDRVRPDALCGFICVTIGEYLAYLIAKQRNIPFLDLRPTRIKNYFYAGESVHEPSPAMKKTYDAYFSEGIPADIQQEASHYLADVRRTHAMYEGVLPASGNLNKPGPGPLRQFVPAARSLLSRIRKYYAYTSGEFRHDTHHINDFRDIYLNRLKRPLRIRHTDFSLRNRYIPERILKSTEYVFYPLHKEPEVTLLVYGRPFMNQIEVIRNLARSLPVGMKLIVKEHPASKGYRSLSYYRKILAVPNVLLAHVGMDSRVLVQHARMVAVISGSVGLEALMMKKPVFHFGNVPFSMLPDSMIRHAGVPDNLALEISDLLNNHAHDEKALTAFIAAVMKMSVPVNFYTTLLGRSGVYAPDGDVTYNKEIDRLAGYLADCLPGRHTH